MEFTKINKNTFIKFLLSITILILLIWFSFLKSDKKIQTDNYFTKGSLVVCVNDENLRTDRNGVKLKHPKGVIKIGEIYTVYYDNPYGCALEEKPIIAGHHYLGWNKERFKIYE